MQLLQRRGGWQWFGANLPRYAGGTRGAKADLAVAGLNGREVARMRGVIRTSRGPSRDPQFVWSLERGLFVCRNLSGAVVSTIGATGQDVDSPQPFASIHPTHIVGVHFDREAGRAYWTRPDLTRGDVKDRPIRMLVTSKPVGVKNFDVRLVDPAMVAIGSHEIVGTTEEPGFWRVPWNIDREWPFGTHVSKGTRWIRSIEAPLRPLAIKFREHSWTNGAHRVRDLLMVPARQYRWSAVGLYATAILQPPLASVVSAFTAGPRNLDTMLRRTWRDPMVAEGADPLLVWISITLGLLCAYWAWRQARVQCPHARWFWVGACTLLGPIGLLWMRLCVSKVAVVGARSVRFVEPSRAAPTTVLSVCD